MSDKIVDNIIDRIDTYLDRIEELLDSLSLIRSDHKELVDSIYEFYLDLEKAVDRVADLRMDEMELRDKDARISEALSPSLIKSLEEHAMSYEGDGDNALMEEL